MQTGESHSGHDHPLPVPALTKSARRISVEFTIVMLKDKQDRPWEPWQFFAMSPRRFDELRTLKRQLAARANGAASIDAPA
jgi:hypothetical protein